MYATVQSIKSSCIQKGTVYIWSSTRQKLSPVVLEQQRCRSVCAFGQSDHCLCYSPFGKYHIKTFHDRNFNFLASRFHLAGWFESYFVNNPANRFSRVVAHLLTLISLKAHKCISSHPGNRYKGLSCNKGGKDQESTPDPGYHTHIFRP